MTLENITGNLLAYKQLEPGTFLHVDQLTIERRTNIRFRYQRLYAADGAMYTVDRSKPLWVITREPQNLVLQNIDEAYRQLTGQWNYFPDTESARVSVAHPDSVEVDLKGLELVRDNVEYGRFRVDPRNVQQLNSEQRKAAQRIYGPDEENFSLNMEMFAEAKKTPSVFVLMPDYVQDTLRSNDQEFLGRVSLLSGFNVDSSFSALVCNVGGCDCLRGVRREDVARSAGAPES